MIKTLNFLDYRKDSINIILKNSQNIEKIKKHSLVFKVAISELKNYFLLITFLNLYINIC